MKKISQIEERLWFANRLDHGFATYNQPMAFHLKGPLNVKALETALHSLVEIHPQLRQVFVEKDGRPSSVVLPTAKMPLIHHNAPLQQAIVFLEKIIREPILLEHPPLMQTALVQIDDQEWLFLLNWHHIIVDGHSIGVFLRQLSALYNHGAKAKQAILEENFKKWEEPVAHSESIDYWKNTLQGASFTLELPKTSLLPHLNPRLGDFVNHYLDPALAKKLADFAAKEKTTLFRCLISAFAALLYRYTGQEDFIIGYPVDLRTETVASLGICINNLPLRFYLDTHTSFSHLLQHTTKARRKAKSHQTTPFGQIVKAMGSAVQHLRQPLFNICFVLENFSSKDLTLNNVLSEELVLDTKTAKFDLTLMVYEEPQGIRCYFEYATSLFSQEFVRKMFEHFQILIDELLTKPHTPISQLRLLSEEEHANLLLLSRGRITNYPRERNVVELFEEIASARKEYPALRFHQSVMDYQTLNTKANQLARSLQELGIKQHDFVGLYLERSFDLIIGLLAILKAGATYVPIDPNYPQDRKDFMIKDTNLKVLLTQTSFISAFAQGSVQVIALDDASFESKESSHLHLPIDPMDLAYVNYTSGSTGLPKGVEVCHRGIVRLVKNPDWITFSSEDRFLFMSSISFDAFTLEIWAPLLNGGTLCIYPPGSFSSHELGTFLVKEAISHALLTSRLFSVMVDEELDSLQGLKYLLAGGDIVSAKHAKIAFKAHPNCQLINAYGPTENTTITTTFAIRSLQEIETTIPIGRPISNTTAYILDQALQPVPLGVFGELCTGGDGVAKGYLHQEEMSKIKFVPDPFSAMPNAKMYRTGDRVRFLPNGSIEFCGRMDNQVKIRGFRIEMGEIEEVIKQVPQIKDCIVSVWEPEPGDKRLVAYVIGSQSAEDSIRESLQKKLPSYMIPAFFLFLHAFALTPNGKVNRKALPLPSKDLEKKEEVFETQTEKGLAELWSKILNVKVMPGDHFFKIGGDSIHVMQVVSQLKKEQNIEVSVDLLFQFPSLKDFAANIDQGTFKQEKIQKKEKTSPIPLSSNQQMLWIANQLFPHSNAYVISFLFSLKGSLNVSFLEQSLEAVIQRHESLRTYFTEKADQIQQMIEPKGKDFFTYLDISQEPASHEKGLAYLKKLSLQPFDLTKLPLIQFHLVKTGNQKFLGLLNAHHMIFDGWSSDVFFNEWSSYYRMLMQGKSIFYEPLEIQDSDYAFWQKDFLSTKAAKQQIAYWKEKLREAPTLLELPTDKQRPPRFTEKNGIVTLQLRQSMKQSLLKIAQEQRVSLFVLLITTFAVQIYRISQKEDMIIGTPYANRGRSELEPVIGFIAQVLALRFDLSGNLPFSDLLQKCNKTIYESYKNSDIPFEKVINEINPPRSASYSALVQIGFSFVNLAKAAFHLEAMEKIEGDLLLENKEARGVDLYFTVTEKESGLFCHLEYYKDLWDEDSAERLLTQYQTLLESIIEHPSWKIDELSLLTPQERHQLLVEWNETATPYPRDTSVCPLFEQTVEKYPDRVALRYRGLSMTYRELNRAVNRLARYLQRLGVKRQDFVGLYLERSFDLIIGILAILKAGGIYVPIDASYPMERKRFMIEDTALQIILTQSSFANDFPKEGIHLICLDTEKESFQQESESNLPVSVGPLDLAYVNYTSGSTGKPKGVLVEHRGIVRLVRNINWETISPEDRFLQISNISFDALTHEIWGALLNGASICIYPQIDLSPEELGKFILEEGVTQILFTARLFTLMVEEALDLMKNVRCLCSCGDVMSVKHATRAFETLKNTQVKNTCGHTENTTHTVTYNICDSQSIERGVPVGRPISNTTIYILDKNLQPMPIGIPGEWYLGGDGVAKGYLNRDALTQERFIRDPFCSDPNARLYRTGDLVRYLPDGNVAYLGRIDNQVKIRGFRIELGEIEETVRSIHAVADCVAIVREDVPGDKRVVAYIELKEKQTITSDEIRTKVQTKLPQYMLPSFFIILEKFPITQNGKLDRKALPSPVQVLKTRMFEPPQTTVERMIADLWSVLLKIPNISRYDNFFQIGGHSITAAQLSTLASKAFEVSIPVNLIFEDSVLENYAKRIDRLISADPAGQKEFISTAELFWIWRNRESILDLSISPEGPPPIESQYTHPKAVFLTGCTGLVGAFFIKELLETTEAKIYCHVRAKTEEEALSRIKEVMQKYLIWNDAASRRIVAVAGDLEKKLLGISLETFELLAEKIDSIFHIGAYVNHALPYHKLKAANVTGTVEAMRLACRKRSKPFHFVSTLSILSMQPPKGLPICEEVDIRESTYLLNGYAQSKWVAETLVKTARSRGVFANIYRLSRVSGHFTLGSGPTGDFLWRVVQASILLKKAPEIALKEDITPVDYICQALRSIASQSDWINREYHLMNPKQFFYRDIFKILQHLGYPMQQTDYPSWHQTLVQEAVHTGREELKALTALFAEIDLSEIGGDVRISQQQASDALKKEGIVCPHVDEALFQRYIEYYVKIGFLPPLNRSQ